MKFKTSLFLAGKTATGIIVPATIIESLGSGKRPPVVVTINKYSYRSTVAVMNGKFMLPVAGEHREKAGIKAGENIEVDLALDKQPRIVEVPKELEQAFKLQHEAKKIYEALSFTKQKEIARQINDAKTDETRKRRIGNILSSLK